MPDCGATPFRTDDGRPYLEVHHILPLSEGGEDGMLNVAALCPNCHRAQHHADRRDQLREDLQKVRGRQAGTIRQVESKD
ncbi:MAG: HNH endonuclease [Gemmatimonadetes bacterium]|nr:HNH endonuclease [Gemmatimonadota bacterium]